MATNKSFTKQHKKTVGKYMYLLTVDSKLLLIMRRFVQYLFYQNEYVHH